MGCSSIPSGSFLFQLFFPVLLPETGGIGTTIFTVGGVLLIAAAVVILIMKKKNENELEAKN